VFKSVTPSSEEWLIKEKGFKFSKQKMWESIFTLGNGYMGLRGSFEENPHGSYRGLYIAGIFDKAEAFVPELVKAPGWLDFSVWVDSKKFNVDSCKVLSHERVLDMKKGILFRTTRLRNKDGRIIRFESKRAIFAHQVRGSVLMICVTPENFSGEINILSGLNGEMTNLGYYPRERIKHLSPVCMKRDLKHVYLEMETRDNKIRIAMASNTVFENAPAGTKKVSRIYGEKFSEHISFQAEKGKEYYFTKWVSIFTSREGYETQLEAAATDLLHDMVHDGLSYHLNKHIEVREKMWEKADVEIKGDRKAQKGIRFNIYHLLIAKPHHDQTVSIGAKFLTGEGYKGHAFWDTEIFILPFYVYNFPDDAKNLLLYRYYTLKGAMKNAKKIGCRRRRSHPQLWLESG
jgi:kojibiose phosphorylase